MIRLSLRASTLLPRDQTNAWPELDEDLVDERGVPIIAFDLMRFAQPMNTRQQMDEIRRALYLDCDSEDECILFDCH